MSSTTVTPVAIAVKPKKEPVQLPVFTNEEYAIMVKHIQNCKEKECLVSHFLLLAFNPLIVSVSQRFRDNWVGDFSELILLTRTRFLLFLFRYAVGGPYYFRFFMSRALLFDVRDCVWKDRRQQGLLTWYDCKIEPPDESTEGWNVPSSDLREELDNAVDLKAIIGWLQETTTLTDIEKDIFLLHIQGATYREIKLVLFAPPQGRLQKIVEEVRAKITTQFVH